MGRGPTETRGAVHIGVALSQSLGSRQAGGGINDSLRRSLAWGMQGPSRGSVRGDSATLDLVLDGTGYALFTWTPSSGGHVSAKARAYIDCDADLDAEAWAALTPDNVNGEVYSRQRAGSAGVAVTDFVVSPGGSLYFAVNCPAAAGQPVNAIFAATPVASA